VASSAPSAVINIAAVSGGGQINTANDLDTDATTINPAASTTSADLTITKSHSGNFTPGQTGARYTLTVRNIGGASTSGTVTVTDTLPTGLTATALSGSGWTCVLSTRTCTRSTALAAAASYPSITLTVNVASNAPSAVTNVARVTGGGQTNTSNDTASDPTAIVYPLVSSYSFEEGVGTTTADAAGNNPGLLVSGLAWTTTGKIGKALSFDGVNDHVDLGNGPTLQITGSLSISAWIFQTGVGSLNSDAAIVSKKEMDAKRIGFQLDTSKDQGPRGLAFRLGTGRRFGSTTIQMNRWYHVVGVYDAAARTIHVYVNGVLDDSTKGYVAPSGSQLNSSLNAYIGKRASTNGYEFKGTIDEVRIYNRAITPSEITALFNAGNTQ
jgi:uncharacterized repeat protein (TIGR01451 family)